MQVQRVYQLARLLACAHLTGFLRKRFDGLDGLDWLEAAPAMVRACSSSRRQSRSRRSDCVVIVSCASHAGLLTGLACRAEHALALPKLPSHVYTCTPAGGAWTVCPALDRHPRARHLSLTKDRHSHVKGPQVYSRATTTSLALCSWTTTATTTTINTNDDGHLQP